VNIDLSFRDKISRVYTHNRPGGLLMSKAWITRLYPYILVAVVAGAVGGVTAGNLQDSGRVQQRPIQYHRQEDGQKSGRMCTRRERSRGL
jgi:hypothetical protein